MPDTPQRLTFLKRNKNASSTKKRLSPGSADSHPSTTHPSDEDLSSGTPGRSRDGTATESFPTTSECDGSHRLSRRAIEQRRRQPFRPHRGWVSQSWHGNGFARDSLDRRCDLAFNGLDRVNRNDGRCLAKLAEASSKTGRTEDAIQSLHQKLDLAESKGDEQEAEISRTISITRWAKPPPRSSVKILRRPFEVPGQAINRRHKATLPGGTRVGESFIVQMHLYWTLDATACQAYLRPNRLDLSRLHPSGIQNVA